MKTSRRLTAIIEREDDAYVALCPELDVASQGDTVESARKNLVEALELFFESADASEISHVLCFAVDSSSESAKTAFRRSTVVKKIVCVSLLATVVVATAAANAGAQSDPLRAGAQRTYDVVKGYITRAAEKMPEEHYSFKPTKDVRSFGQLIGHIADASFGFCSAVAGDKPPMGGFDGTIEKSTTTKDDLQKALAAAFGYCDKVYASTSDNTATFMVKGFWGELPKLSVLDFNTAHDFEHYGNIVTYMRLKDIVPPSSEPRK